MQNLETQRQSAGKLAPMRDAGNLQTWVDEMDAALIARTSMPVPCGSCTACCQAAQFIRVEADDHAARAAIPAELLFPLPGEPGTHLLGYDDQGRCPMLKDNQCSIYSARPAACQTFDCRIYAATGIATGADQQKIQQRVDEWQFLDDPRLQQALKSASAFVRKHRAKLFNGSPPAAQLALATLKVHNLFLNEAQPTFTAVEHHLHGPA